MDVIKVVQQIRDKFNETGSPAIIPLIGGRTCTITLLDDGVEVSNLGNQPFLHWSAFQEAVCTMIRGGGNAMRGNAMNSRLGGPNLSLDSIEGHIAQVVYGKRVGQAVFRRIVPIAAILVWAGICSPEPNMLVLID